MNTSSVLSAQTTVKSSQGLLVTSDLSDSGTRVKRLNLRQEKRSKFRNTKFLAKNAHRSRQIKTLRSPKTKFLGLLNVSAIIIHRIVGWGFYHNKINYNVGLKAQPTVFMSL